MNTIKSHITTFLAGFIILTSCQKTTDDSTPPVLKPKVGTSWNYRYQTYHSNGGVFNTVYVTYKAVSEETLVGEKWLKIIDAGADTLEYYLKEKADGLYIFANNQAWLLCKKPAAPLEQFTSYYNGQQKSFKVLTVNDTLVTNVGNLPVYLYEGVNTGGVLTDNIWYNEKVWIARAYTYKSPLLGTAPPYCNSALFLESITY